MSPLQQSSIGTAIAGVGLSTLLKVFLQGGSA